MLHTVFTKNNFLFNLKVKFICTEWDVKIICFYILKLLSERSGEVCCKTGFFICPFPIIQEEAFLFNLAVFLIFCSILRNIRIIAFFLQLCCKFFSVFLLTKRPNLHSVQFSGCCSFYRRRLCNSFFLQT